MNKVLSLILSAAVVLAITFVTPFGASAAKTLANDFNATTASGSAVTETDEGIQIQSTGALFATVPGVTAKSAVTLNNLEFSVTGKEFKDSAGAIGMPGTAVPEIVVLLTKAACGYNYGANTSQGGLAMVIDFIWNNPNVGDFLVPIVTFYSYDGTNFWNGSVAGGSIAGTTAAIGTAKFGTEMKFKFVSDSTLGAKVYLNDTLLKKSDGADIDLSFISSSLVDGNLFFGMFPYCGQNHNLPNNKHSITATLNSLNKEAVSSLQETFDGTFKLANFYKFNADSATDTSKGINLKMTAPGHLWSTHPTLIWKEKSDLNNLVAEITLDKYAPECDQDLNETPQGFLPVVALGLTHNPEPFAYGMPAGTGKNAVFFLRVKDDGSSYIEIFKADEGTNLTSVANTNGVADGAAWGDKVTVRLKKDNTYGYRLYLNGVLQQKAVKDSDPVALDLNFIKDAFSDGKAFFQISEFDNAGTAPLEITFNNLYTYVPHPAGTTQKGTNVNASGATLNAAFTDIDDESVTGFGFEYKEESANEWTKIALKVGETSATITGLKASTKYVFHTYIVQNAESIFGEDQEFTTAKLDTKPEKPSIPDTGDIALIFVSVVLLAAGTTVFMTRKKVSSK